MPLFPPYSSPAIAHKPPRSPTSPSASKTIGLHSISTSTSSMISRVSDVLGSSSQSGSSSSTQASTVIAVDCSVECRADDGQKSPSGRSSPLKQLPHNKKAFSVDSCKKKLSPSKRIDTFDNSHSSSSKACGSKDSPNKTSSLKNRRRRRRSLSLCESFSDGESTDGEFTFLVCLFSMQRIFRTRVWLVNEELERFFLHCKGYILFWKIRVFSGRKRRS